jgi:hypothetical protein
MRAAMITSLENAVAPLDPPVEIAAAVAGASVVE